MKVTRCLSQKSYIIHGFRLNDVRCQWLVVTPVTGFLYRLRLLTESISNPAESATALQQKGIRRSQHSDNISPKLSGNCALKFCSLSRINCFLRSSARFSLRRTEGIHPSSSARLLGLSVPVLPQQRWLSSRYLQLNQAENSAYERGYFQLPPTMVNILEEKRYQNSKCPINEGKIPILVSLQPH